ncbi:hypothetical protein ACFFW8_15030 [Erwinia tracheiphila]
MVAQAAYDLPATQQHVFVLREGMEGYQAVSSELKALYPDAIIKTIDKVTEDQACPALIDFEALAEQGKPVSGAITTGTCDHAALYDANKFQQLVNDPTIDVIVRGVRGYPNVASYPQMLAGSMLKMA